MQHSRVGAAVRRLGRLGRTVACGAGLAFVALSGCESDSLLHNPVPLTRLHTDRNYVRDDYGRYVFFHGLNVSGSTKNPRVDAQTGLANYLDKPFPLEKARSEFKKLRDRGTNSIRLLVMWEGVEPKAKGQYDQAYLDYIRQLVQIAGEYNIHVLLDMHQDMFSRHMYVKYNEHPKYGQPGSIEATLTALIPPYTDTVKGDGAPRWVVEACLQEKNLSSSHWGTPRLVSGMDPEQRSKLIELYQKMTGSSGSPGEIPEWIQYISDNAPQAFPLNETTDLLPFTNWGVSAALSVDMERLFACLLAGDKAFPGLEKDGVNVKDYLQEAYAGAWKQVAEKVKDLPNVMGYDIINEPEGNFILLSAVAGAMTVGAQDGAKQALIGLFGDEKGALMYDVVLGLRLIPPDTNPETLRMWGLDKLDALNITSLNLGFDRNYLRPFHSRVGKAIQEVDPKAVIYIEPSMNITTILGSNLAGGMWDVSMTRPEGLNHVVFAPHNYADIYPFIGFNQPPRDLSVEEVRYRDYRTALQGSRDLATHALGNMPVVFGEFGTYFNFGGIQASIASNYAVSSQVLDNYYEAFEGMFQSNILWCYSPENDYEKGEGWNKEDFSVIDPAGNPRSELAWNRPYAKALAGKPVSTHFYSDYHYFDPDKGEQIPLHEFEVRYESKETDAPSEIFVPQVQYPNGFYVWVSDGRCYYDARTHVLYHYPEKDEPKTEHSVRLLPPLANQENVGWNYFFDGDRGISR